MLLDCIIITLILGIVPIIEKYIIQFIEVETYIVLIGLLFFVYVFIYHFLVGHEHFYHDLQVIKKNKHIFFLMVFSSFLLFIVNNYLNLTLLKKNAAYLITAITSAFPIFTAMFAVILLNEKISFNHFVGIMFTLLGVTLLNTSDLIPDFVSFNL